MSSYELSSLKSKAQLKIAVMGKGVVGKSSLTYRFINYNAPKDHDPTIEDRYKTTSVIDGEEYEIEILDTAGEEDYQNMMDSWINFSEGFLLVFALNDTESFELLTKKRERIIKVKTPQMGGKTIPMVLVGNKKDLENERKITYSDARKLADSWNIEYIETSAKTNLNCKYVFERLASRIVKNKGDGRSNKSGKCCVIY